MKIKSIDKIFLGIILSLVIIGIIMFTSASLGILAKNETKFYSVLFSQLVFGVGGGIVAAYIGFRIPYRFWRNYSLYIFLLCIVLIGLVFVPSLGFEHGGALRWIKIAGFSFQPVEFLKIGFIIYFAAWLSWVKTKSKDLSWSLIPLIVFASIIVGLLIKQHDHKDMILMAVSAFAMLFVSGIPWKYIFIMVAISLVGFGILATTTPYVKARINTFINPSQDASGSGYHIQQSLIAVGSGGILGRGLGQSIQKFNYLPEPQGDSIFAVISEELGFIGAVLIIALFVAFAFRGYRIGYQAPDSFSKLFVIGVITLFTAQSFMNIASIIGVFPLTGVPLVFISQGGTSLMIALGVMGIVLNISKQNKTTSGKIA